jgi:hypothetical protein
MSMPIDPSKTPKKAKAMSTKRGDKISRVPITFRIVVLQRRGSAADRTAPLIVVPEKLGVVGKLHRYRI